MGTEINPLRCIEETEDSDTLLALLTHFVRQERFQEGLWGQAAKDMIFLNILLKLRQIQLIAAVEEKKEYITRQLARTHHKKYENYVIT